MMIAASCRALRPFIILLFFCIYCGSCFVTCGKLFSTLFGHRLHHHDDSGRPGRVVYTFVGGYLSVCTTDLIQGSIMICALRGGFVGSVGMAGGVENTVAFLQDIPGFLSAAYDGAAHYGCRWPAGC